ncbi:hypothetical protein EMCRGX_G016447 [Ephydatia muelleri]
MSTTTNTLGLTSNAVSCATLGLTSDAVLYATIGPTSPDVDAISGGSVSGGVLILCCLCTCSICLCKKRSKISLSRQSQRASEETNMRTNGSIIQDLHRHLQSMMQRSAQVPEQNLQMYPLPSNVSSNSPAPSSEGQNHPAPSSEGQNPPAPSSEGQNPPAPSSEGQNPPAPSSEGQNPPAPSSAVKILQHHFPMLQFGLKWTDADSGEEQTLNVITRAINEYRNLGMLLLNDDNLHFVKTLEHKHRNDPQEITEEIFRKWINEGPTPVNWCALIGIFREVGLNALADDIQEARADGNP